MIHGLHTFLKFCMLLLTRNDQYIVASIQKTEKNIFIDKMKEKSIKNTSSNDFFT